jgi:hypothetical protein
MVSNFVLSGLKFSEIFIGYKDFVSRIVEDGLSDDLQILYESLFTISSLIRSNQ